MKNKIKLNIVVQSLIVGMIGAIFLSSCDNYIDVTPKDRVTSAAVWQSTGNADLFLNNIYNAVEPPCAQPLAEAPRENYSDNSVNSIAGRYDRTTYNLSAYTPDYTNPNWGKAHDWNQFDYIRRANLFIESVSASDLDENWKKLRLAEARFLRVFFYQKIWTTMGGFPIITKVLNLEEQGDEIFMARSSIEECFEFMNQELEDIIQDLPERAENGRISKWAALALKGWIELFHASPLHNDNNSIDRWEKAASTYKKIIDEGNFTLFPNYYELFLEDNNYNSEVIWQTPSDPNLARLQNRYSYMVAPQWLENNVFVGFQLSTPTQDLVDEYSMNNGLPITNPLSGYNSQDPYVDREQRFYASILYDGAPFAGSRVVMKQGINSNNQTDFSGTNAGTLTGYNWKKMVDPKYYITGNADNTAGWIWYRYAEVLLGYAEAKANTFSEGAIVMDESIYDAINKIRQRGGIPDITPGLTKEELIKIIMKERRVEFPLEEKRWYDLLRLKLAMDKLNGPVMVMLIENLGNGWEYKIVPSNSEPRVFHERNYFLPIPQSAIDRNPKLDQNPGY